MFIQFLPSKYFPEKVSGYCPNCERLLYLDRNLLRSQKEIKCFKCKQSHEIITIAFEKDILIKVNYEK